MNIAIFGKKYDTAERAIIQRLLDTLVQMGCNMSIELSLYKQLQQDTFII